jgi:Concanavalin A-like lectin/glucanases superfamily
VNGATLTTDRFGKANAAYNFDGSSNIQLSNPTDFGITTFTWSAWVNASVLATLNVPKTIFSVGNSAGDQHINMYYWDVSGQSGWNYGSYTSPTTAALPYLISYNSVSTNNWVHIVIVRTATERKMYINGQLSVSYTAAPAFYNTPILAAIGSRYNGVQPFNGKIDDLKIYNGALSDEEVSLLYNEEQGECSSPCSGMIYSLGSGSWNAPATWSCGRVPDLTDKVLIKAGHTVTIPTNDAKARKLVNNGQVSLANSTSKLTFGTSPATPTTITLTLQPGPLDGKDAEASSYSPNLVSAISPYTNLYAWTISGVPITKRFYLGFDISSIPTNAVVDSAFLSLSFGQTYINNGGNYHDGHDGNNIFTINRVTSTWQQNTLTWNTQPSFVATNQVVIPAYTYNRQHYPKMNVKNMVADMVANPTSSFGFCMKHLDETVYRLTFFATSDEVTNPALRPKLQVYYHLP